MVFTLHHSLFQQNFDRHFLIWISIVGIITDSDFVAIAIHLMEQLELVEPEESLDEVDEDF